MDRNILKSEFLKFFSYHWTIFGFICAIFLPPIALYLALYSSFQTGSTMKSFIVPCLRSLYLGQIGIVIAMAGFIGQEYSHSSLRTTFLSKPSRIKLILAKEMVMTLTSIMFAISTSVFCFFVIIANVRFSESVNLICILKYISYILPTFISWVFLGLIAGNLVIITKSFIVPIAVLFSMLLGLSQMFLAITKLAIYLPDLAVMNVFQIENHKVFLKPQIGIFVQFLWLVIICFVSIYCFKKRDIR